MLSRFWPGTSFYHLGNTYVIIRAQCFKTLQEQKQFEPALKDGRTGCVCSVIVSMTQLRLHREHGSCDTHTWSAVSARHAITRNPIKPRYEACLIPKHPKVSNQNSMLCACVCVSLAVHQHVIAEWGSNDWHQHRYCGAGQHLGWKGSKFWFLPGWCCMEKTAQSKGALKQMAWSWTLLLDAPATNMTHDTVDTA